MLGYFLISSAVIPAALAEASRVARSCWRAESSALSSSRVISERAVPLEPVASGLSTLISAMVFSISVLFLALSTAFCSSERLILSISAWVRPAFKPSASSALRVASALAMAAERSCQLLYWPICSGVRYFWAFCWLAVREFFRVSPEIFRFWTSVMER